jgi:hypothetical protein
LSRGDRDHAGRAKKAIAHLVAPATLVKDGAFGFAGGRFLAEGFVQVGIKRLANGIDRGDAVFSEESVELALDELEPRNHGSDILGRGCGL